MPNPSLTQKFLKEILHYDNETGNFTWLVSRGNSKAGNVAGTLCHGYLVITINSKNYLAHRLAWFYIHNVWPKNQIDHINHKRTDNRSVNLREVTSQGNHRNQTQYKNNTSDVCGVSWVKSRKKWLAFITIDSILINLGRFTDKFEAICARKSAEAKHCFHANHGT